MLLILERELYELRRSPVLLLSMASLPASLVGVPLVTVWYLMTHATDVAVELLRELYPVTVTAPAEVIAAAAAFNWLPVFLVMPVYLPILVAAQSVGGERDRRTLEPLLATPVSTAAIVIGKSVAAVIPAVLITWASAAVFIGGLDLLVVARTGAAPLPDGPWLWGVLVLAPLLALFGNTLAVVISAKVADTRAAQNLSAMSVVPLVGLLVAQITGKIAVGMPFYVGLAGVLLVVDLLLVAAAVALVGRERLLVSWR
jgi:ABC-type Na+ efflux pump permease subunit